MIAKDLAPLLSGDKRLRAGHQAEKQLAFYLSRAFGHDPSVLVFNDLRLEQEGDATQIDHLVLSRYGFVLIESKSVRGRFVVNGQGEWASQYGTKVQGIPSPVLQAKRQADFLKSYLSAWAPELLGRMLGIQTTFRTLPFDVLVAISDGGTLSRPKSLQLPEVLKADQVPEAIRSLHAAYKKDRGVFGANNHRVLSPDELERIHAFLLARHKPLSRPKEAPLPRAVEPASPASSYRCKHCQSAQLELRWGKYSYYFKCLACQGNTPVQKLCGSCGEREKFRKEGKQFYAECRTCSTSATFFSNPQLPLR